MMAYSTAHRVLYHERENKRVLGMVYKVPVGRR